MSSNKQLIFVSQVLWPSLNFANLQQKLDYTQVVYTNLLTQTYTKQAYNQVDRSKCGWLNPWLPQEQQLLPALKCDSFEVHTDSLLVSEQLPQVQLGVQSLLCEADSLLNLYPAHTCWWWAAVNGFRPFTATNRCGRTPPSGKSSRHSLVDVSSN
jgi:hypothetical protein